MNRRSFLTQCALGSAGLALFTQGCQPSATPGAALADAAAERTIEAHPADEARVLEPPAIDRAAPQDVETATFALG